jgi:hypothetical protein
VSELLEPTLPPSLRRLLDDGESGIGAGLALQLLTVGEDGWPYASMVSVGEIVAINDQRLRLALWPRSQATANVVASGRAMLLTVVDGVGYSVRLRVSADTPIPNHEHGSLSTFDAQVTQVRADVAPYARLESGIRFELLEPDTVIPRWAETRRLLRMNGADIRGSEPSDT